MGPNRGGWRTGRTKERFVDTRILAAGWALYRSDLLSLWGGIALVVVPVQLFALAVRTMTVTPGRGVVDGQLQAGGYPTHPALGISLWVLFSVGSFVAGGALCRRLLDRAQYDRTDLADSYRFPLDRLPSLVWTGLLLFIFSLLGQMALIIPGLYLMGALAVTIPVVMAEGLTGIPAMERSRALVRGHWRRTASVIVAAVIISLACAFVIGFLIGLILSGFPAKTPFELFVERAIPATVVDIVILPYVMATQVALYLDLKALYRGSAPEHLVAPAPLAVAEPTTPAIVLPDTSGSVPPPGWK